MRINRLFWILPLLLVLLTGCTASPTPAGADSSMTVITLETTPALSHWLPLAASCVEGLPDLGLAAEVLTRENLSPGAADLSLRLGPREESDPFVTVLGQEKLVILAGADVPVNSLSIESLLQVYSDEGVQWSALPEWDDSAEADGPVITLGYPRGHELAEFFDQIYLNASGNYTVTQSYSTIEHLTNLIEENPTAIAFTLASQKPAAVRTLIITDGEPDAESIWVLAITPSEPTDGLMQLLLCLQNAQ